MLIGRRPISRFRDDGMGSGASCCCGGKSTDVIATNTDARPWTKDESTGPEGTPDSDSESLRVCRPTVVMAPF